MIWPLFHDDNKAVTWLKWEKWLSRSRYVDCSVEREVEVKASVVDRYMRRDIWFSIPSMQTAGRERVK